MKVSVAIATYNGEKYLSEQLFSIINQTYPVDEIIISDDGSSDKTLDIIKSFQSKENNIILIEGPKQGVKMNFNNALNHTKGDFIFLCDQDDIWEKDKVEVVVGKFNQNNVLAIVHDAFVVDCTGQIIYSSFFSIRNSKSGFFKNIIKNSYIGCCMAIRRELIEKALPIPDNVEMHDWWIGMIAELNKSTMFLNDKLIKYRRHNNNVSQLKHYNLKKMIKNRIILLYYLVLNVFRSKFI